MDASNRQRVTLRGKQKSMEHHAIIDHPNVPDCNMAVSRQTMVGSVSTDDDIREKLNSIRSLSIGTHTSETSTTPLWIPDVMSDRRSIHSEPNQDCASFVRGRNIHDVSSASVCDHHTTKFTSERDVLLKNITHLLNTNSDVTQDQTQRLNIFDNPLHLSSKPPDNRSEMKTSLKQSSMDILDRLQKVVTEAYEQAKHDEEFTVILKSLLNMKSQGDDTTLRQLDRKRWNGFDCRPFQGPKTPPSPNSRQRVYEFEGKRSHTLCERTYLEQLEVEENHPSTSKLTDSHRNRSGFAVAASNVREESSRMISCVNESDGLDLSRSHPIMHHCSDVVHSHSNRDIHNICSHRGNANVHSSQSRLRMENDVCNLGQVSEVMKFRKEKPRSVGCACGLLHKLEVDINRAQHTNERISDMQHLYNSRRDLSSRNIDSSIPQRHSNLSRATDVDEHDGKHKQARWMQTDGRRFSDKHQPETETSWRSWRPSRSPSSSYASPLMDTCRRKIGTDRRYHHDLNHINDRRGYYRHSDDTELRELYSRRNRATEASSGIWTTSVARRPPNLRAPLESLSHKSIYQRPYNQRNGSKRNGRQNRYSGPPSPYAVACSYNANTVVNETPESPPDVRTQTRLFQAPTTENRVYVDSPANLVGAQDQWILAGLDLSTYNTDELRRLRNWITFSQNAGQMLATSGNLATTTSEAEQLVDTFTDTNVSVSGELPQAQQKQQKQHDQPQTVKMQEPQPPMAAHNHLDTSQPIETGPSELTVKSRRRSISSSSSASTSSSSNTSTTGDSSGSADSSSTNESSYVSSTVSDRSRPHSVTVGLVEPELKQSTFPHMSKVEGDGKCHPQVAPKLLSCDTVKNESESPLINPDQRKFISDQIANDPPARESSLHFDHVRTSPAIQVSLMENGRSPSTNLENRAGGVTEITCGIGTKTEDQGNNGAQIPAVEEDGTANIPFSPKSRFVHNCQLVQSVCTSADVNRNTLDSSISLHKEEILKSHSTSEDFRFSRRRDTDRKHKEKSLEQVIQADENDSKHFDMDTSEAHLSTAEDEEEEEEEGEVVSDCTSDVDDFQTARTANKHSGPDGSTTSVPPGLETRSHGYIRSAAHKVIKKSSPTLRAAVSSTASSPTRVRESSEFKRPSTPKYHRKQLFDSQRTCRNTRFTNKRSTDRERENRLWTSRVSYTESYTEIPERSRRIWKGSRMQRDPKRLVSHRMYLLPQPIPRRRGRRNATDRNSDPLYRHSLKSGCHYKERLTTRLNTRPYSQGKGYGKHRPFDLREYKLNRTH
ncbi:hypothetical protein EG68_05839 [Paragonimus skrjabini miyazakii]|uniref:Uncharacterized protein n=1 Tax=Paragonimus skrjabini miyazakii TaxID=59628 RepID=A0A8S9YWE9_9TREM|nr:hypothetical protein EG68_05839 [Paragonimus skrjabini miyazakii]